jgi:DNA-binding CsgD family transcriptional regulator
VALAEALGGGRFRVIQVHLNEGVVTGLQRARIDRMARRAKLSKRELAVLDLVLLGRTSADVAKALGITERTARFHVGNIFAKLQADSRSDLLRLLL